MDENCRKYVLAHCREMFWRQRRRERGVWPRLLIAFGSFLGALCCLNILLVQWASLGSLVESSLVMASLELYAIATGAWLMAGALWIMDELRDRLAWRRFVRGDAQARTARLY